MCRWAAWIGQPIFLGQIVSDPGHSLIDQARAADMCKTVTNADGFGLAWYDQHAKPGLYRDVYPAWSDPNLRSVCAQVRSSLFLSHIRASTGSAVSRDNCHPFTSGRWSFMHNGQIGGYDNFRKSADIMIADDLYCERRGTTDSETMFLLALGAGLDHDPHRALCWATTQLAGLSRDRGTAPHMRLAAAFSDGKRLYAVRYASDQWAPTVYFRKDDQNGGWAVVSEPLESGQSGWSELPPGSFCTFDGTDAHIQAFEPEAARIAAE